MKIKNQLTVTRGEWGITGERRRKIKSESMYKEPMGKDNGGGEE